MCSLEEEKVNGLNLEGICWFGSVGSLSRSFPVDLTLRHTWHAAVIQGRPD